MRKIALYLPQFQEISKNNEWLGKSFTDWDNTLRRCKYVLLFTFSTPDIFKEYLRPLIKKTKQLCKIDLIFINAMNEWIEGAFYESDERYGNVYLETLKEALEENDNNVPLNLGDK